MKRFLITFVFALSAILCFSQKNPVDEMFAKYSEMEGFTSVMISGRMLSLLGGTESGDNSDNILLRIKSIQILSEDDSLSTGTLNFYTELSKKLDFSVYEELMSVKEASEVTKFLIRQKGNIIQELLMISGGKNGNSLISIRGEFLLKEIQDISKSVGIKELEQLEDLEKK